MKALPVAIGLALVAAFSGAAQAHAQGIAPDDATAAPPTIRFEYAFYAVPADFPYLWVSAYRVGNLKGRATAAWTTADSSASSGTDYRQSTGELSWADGVGGAQQLYVPLIPRRAGPYDRTFTVLLHDQTGAALSFPSAAVVTITQPSVWQLWADASTAAAGGGANSNPFGVTTGLTGSAVTSSPSDGAVNPASANPNANPNANAGTTTNPSANPSTGTGSGSDHTIPSGGDNTLPTQPGSTIGTAPGTLNPVIGGGGASGTDPTATPTTGAASGTGAGAAGSGLIGGDGGSTSPQSAGGAQPATGISGGGESATALTGAGSGSSSATGSDPNANSTPTATGAGTGTGAQQPQQQQPQQTGGSTTLPGSNQPVQPTGLTGGSQQSGGGGSSIGGGGGNTQASTGILSQFASAFAWDSAAYQTDNSNNFVVVGVSRLQMPLLGVQPCSVRYSTVDGTGRAGVDYTATSGVLEYGANDFSPRAIFVPIRQGDANSPPSGVKVFAIRLTDPVNAFLGVPSSAPISVSAVPFSEGKVVLTSDAYATPVQAGKAVATVQRLIGSQGAVNVSYSTTDGTARAGTDYTATTGLLSWADGDTSPRNVSVPLLATSTAVKALPDTGTVAGAPNFFLSLALGSDSKGFLGGPRTAAMFITNLAPRSTTGTGSGTGTATTQANVGTGTGTGGNGSGTGTGSNGHGSSSTGSVKPNASSTGTNKPPVASSTGTRVPPVVVPPPSTTGTAGIGTGSGTNTTATDERSAAVSVRGLAPAALLTVLLSALWLSA